jgi:hypothetical protein
MMAEVAQNFVRSGSKTWQAWLCLMAIFKNLSSIRIPPLTFYVWMADHFNYNTRTKKFDDFKFK